MSRIRESLVAMEKALSRRAFLGNVVKGIGVAAAYDRFGDKLFGITPGDAAVNYQKALQIFSAFGRLVIPVDQDPGWATFEPGITEYGLNVYIRQVFNLGHSLAFDGFAQAVVAFNEIPPVIQYGPKFLDMNQDAQGTYLYNILASNFENDGVQDLLAFASVFMLLGSKQTFFLNYPKHLAVPNSEFQVLTGNSPKTGWDILGFRGPVGPAEETALRLRAQGAPEYPGVDLRNPYI
ncbi:MAG: hypothetical protein ABL995_00380 [Bryobacteraceae bacterium]